MYKVKFDNGYVVNFEKEPTQVDIDEAASHMSQNIKPSIADKQPTGFFQEAKERFGKVVESTKQNFQDIGTQYDKTKNLPAMALSATALAPRAVGELVVEGVKQLLPEEFKSDMKSWLKTVVENPNVQKDVIQPLTQKAQEYPQTARAVQDVVDIAAVLPGPKVLSEAEKAAKVAAGGISKLAPAAEKAAGTAVKALERTPAEIKAVKDINQVKINKIVNEIAQAKPSDIPKVKKALSSIDTTGVSSFNELPPILQAKTDSILRGVDDLLAKDTNLYKLKDLQAVKTVGEKTTKFNYVNRALSNLRELYTKTKDIESKSLIDQLIDKAKKQGLSLQEVNGLAREYGTEFAQKAFNKQSGEALTSVNSQMFENIRKGVKNTVRELSPDKKAFEALDSEASVLIRTKKLMDDMATKVSKLEAKIQKESGIMKVGKTVGKTAGRIIDTASGGTIRGLLTSFLPSNIGNKVMNAIDIQNALRKNLITINKLNKETGENFFNELGKLIK